MSLKKEIENFQNQFKQKAPQGVQELFDLATKELEEKN